MGIPPFSTPGRFWRGNLHTHSNLSDGALEPHQVVDAYKRAGYDFLQLSDHFLARYGWPIADTRRLRSNIFTTLIGAEVHAMATSAGELWHILASGLPLDFPPPAPDETAGRLAARAREAGAFVAIAHPAWSQLTIEDGRAMTAAHAVEVYNHGSAVETDRGDGFYLLDQLCNEDRRLTAIATDDAHFRYGDYDAFGGFVMVKSESLDPDALVAALKAGAFYSSQGPRIEDVEVSRSEVRVQSSPVHTVALLTGTSRALTHVGRDVVCATIEVAKAKTAWVETPRDKWFRIVVIDAAGRRAWTNPIWVDALD
jgi:histidinol phosphatase-like PHP family hydrolase